MSTLNSNNSESLEKNQTSVQRITAIVIGPNIYFFFCKKKLYNKEWKTVDTVRRWNSF